MSDASTVLKFSRVWCGFKGVATDSVCACSGSASIEFLGLWIQFYTCTVTAVTAKVRTCFEALLGRDQSESCIPLPRIAHCTFTHPESSP
jgi:hypothetical protein